MRPDIFLSSIFLIFSAANFATAQFTFNATALDSQLAAITTNLIAEQSKIIQMLANQTSIIQKVMANVTNITDVAAALNTMIQIMNNQATANNYAKYVPISTCNDVNVKITAINFEVSKFITMATRAYANATSIYQQNVWISYYYSLNLAKLGIGSANQQNVFNVIQQVNSIVMEYLTYVNMLLVGATTEFGLGTQLSFFKQKFCQCPSTVSTSVVGNVSTLDSNIQYIEAPLISRQQQFISLASTALGFVKTAIPTSLQSSPYVQGIVPFLTNLATISDYSQSTWSNASSCSALLARIGYVTYKYWVLIQAYTTTAQNYTLTAYYRANLNITVNLYNSSLSAAQYDNIVKAIGVMMQMERLYGNYLTQLVFAVNRILHALLDIQALGDNFCACNDGSGTTASTALLSTASSTSASTSSSSTSTSSTLASTTSSSSTLAPTTSSSSTLAPTTSSSSTLAPTTSTSSTLASTTSSSSTLAPTTSSSSTLAPTTSSSSTLAPTTSSSSTLAPTTSSSSTLEPTTSSSSTLAPTTSTSTVSTTIAPICQSTAPVSSATNVYIKTICYIPTALNHADAKTYCTSHGMSLYAITSADTYNGFVSFANTISPSGAISFIGNGITTGNKNWLINSNQTVSLYSGLTWGQALKNGQACMFMSRSAAMVFNAIANDCSTNKQTFMCEF